MALVIDIEILLEKNLNAKYSFFKIQKSKIEYRIRVIKPPLLIKPPLIQNSNKPPLFYPKSPLFGAFLVKFWKNFNKPPAQNLDFFIDCRRFIDKDTVVGGRECSISII